jgi:hypothetical protein
VKKVSRKKTTKPAGKKLSTVLRESSALAPTATLPPKDRQVARLVRDLGQMIESARQQVAVTANAALTSLYWQLGQHVRTKVLEGRRGECGAQIVAAVGRQLETRYGKGFGDKNLQRMVQFATVFPTPRLSPHCGDNWAGHTSSC